VRIYLAGKVGKGDWRHDIVKGLHGAMDGLQFPCEWPVLGGAIHADGSRHDYVGPFFTSCDHGCTHGPNSHGIDGTSPYCSPSLHDLGQSATTHDLPDLRSAIFAQCVRAIRGCDLFFAWLDDATAYGTLVEIGIAHALGKHLCLACSEPPPEDLWFSFHAASRLILQPTPHQGLAVAIKTSPQDIRFRERVTVAMDRCESPIERSYLAALADLALSRNAFKQDLSPEAILPISGAAELWQQYKLNDLRVRLDFAIVGPGVRLAIELDGHNYHERTPEQATRDRSRDRALTSQGWTTIRFTGREVHADARACARQTLEIVETIGAR
jgi:hypothetical protein